MKNIHKVLYVTLTLISISLEVNSQTLGIPETIDYINEKLENNKSSTDQPAKTVWEVSSDGKLTITRYWYKKVSSITTVYLNMLDENKVFIAPHGDSYPNGQPRNDYIQVYTKEDKNVVNYKSDEYNNNSSFIPITFKDDPAVAKQLKNAIVNLIKKAKQNTSYRKKDPFDD